MIEFPKKEKKQPNTAVMYEVEEFIHGRIDFVTDCPFKEKGRYTNTINKVGALECNTCKYQIKNNTHAKVVRCAHEKLEQKSDVKKIFGKRIWD